MRHLLVGCVALLAVAQAPAQFRFAVEQQDGAVKHTGNVRDLVYSPDSKTVASVDDANFHRLAASADGKHLAAVVNDPTEGHPKLIFQSAGGKAVTLMAKTTHGFFDPTIAVSDDGKWVCGWVAAEKGGPGVQVWDTATGEAGSVPGEWPAKPQITFLGDNKTVAIDVKGSGTSPRTIVLADAATGQRTTEAKVPNRHAVSSVQSAVSPSGRHSVSVDTNADMFVYTLPSGAVQARLAGHTAGIYLTRFTPSGRRVISVGNDGTLRFWDVPAN